MDPIILTFNMNVVIVNRIPCDVNYMNSKTEFKRNTCISGNSGHNLSQFRETLLFRFSRPFCQLALLPPHRLAPCQQSISLWIFPRIALTSPHVTLMMQAVWF